MARTKEQQREYQRKWREKRSVTPDVTPPDVTPENVTQNVTPRANKSPSASTDYDMTAPIPWQNIDHSIFDGHGRGVPVNGYVLIALGMSDDKPDHGVVTEQVWRTRKEHTCEHGYAGWSCKACL